MLSILRSLVGRREKDASAPVSFAEAVERADSLVYGIRGDYNNRASAAIRRNDAVPEVTRYLTQRGWRSFRFIGAGDNAFVLQINDDLALRVRGPEDPNLVQTLDPPVAPHVLPTLEAIDFGGVRLNVVPFVPLNLSKALKSDLVTEKEAKMTMDYLLCKGFGCSPSIWFWDRTNAAGFKWEQVGFLAGKPVVVDTGSVIYERDMPPEATQRLASDYKVAEQFRGQFPHIVAQSDWTPLRV